jgi:signal transduction histidine kinase
MGGADILVRIDRAGILPGQECPGMTGKNACPTIGKPGPRKNWQTRSGTTTPAPSTRPEFSGITGRMERFAWGLASGWFSALFICGILGVLAYRRMGRLQQRATDAERLAELGTLTGGLAHEIKNPLSTVQLNLQLLQEDIAPDNPAYSRIINRLKISERETARLRDTLDDFLRYAGKMELDRKPVELNRLCEDLVDFFLPQAQLHKVQLRMKSWPEPVLVEADEKLLKQAMLNLVLNGVQAMPGGGEMILSVSCRDGQAVIDVIDTGSGIAPEAAQRIFDAYYSTKKGGTGLGLAMTRRIIAEHGGTITLTSEPGKGSDFALNLPLT